MIELQDFERNDYSTLINWINLESETHFLQWGGRMAFDSFPIDIVQLEKHIEGSLGEHAVKKIFKAVNAVSGDMVGYIELVWNIGVLFKMSILENEWEK